jgi:phage gpG-like protein
VTTRLLYADDYLRALDRAIEEGARKMAEAARDELRRSILSNFGRVGLYRPSVWPPLSPDYARRVRRPYATLLVTGRLRDSIRFEVTGTTVVAEVRDEDVPYASVHQYGGGNNIPARPYFPIDRDGEVIPTVMQNILMRMALAFKRALRRHGFDLDNDAD